MGISIWQLLIVLVIVVLLFGTKRLKNLGSDLGNAIKGFRSSMDERDERTNADPDKIEQAGTVIDGEVTNKETDKV